MNPLLVACDVYRPAAIDQLTVLGDKHQKVSVYKEVENKNQIEIAKNALAYASAQPQCHHCGHRWPLGGGRSNDGRR